MTKLIQKDTASLTSVAIDSARTTSIIAEGKRTGKPDEEIVREVFGEDGLDDLGKSITLVNLIKDMGKLFGLDDEKNLSKNRAFLGYMMILQHYTQEPEANEFAELFDNAQTVEDVWNYFLKCNGIAESAVVQLSGYDHKWFWQLLKTPLVQNPNFHISLRNPT